MRLHSVLLATLAAALAAANPIVFEARPRVAGIGGKLLLRGAGLGAAADSAVVFEPGVVAEVEERHGPDAAVVRVPIGATHGPVRVLSGVDGALLRRMQTELGVLEGGTSFEAVARIESLRSGIRRLIAQGRPSNGVPVQITAAFSNPPAIARPFVARRGFQFVRNRIVVDLEDFLSFDAALALADRAGARLVGYLPVTNSYILDLKHVPLSLGELERTASRLGATPGVAETWLDMGLGAKAVKFADTDWLDRYRQRSNANLNGREDAYATDRIQAPGAWNLIERFAGANGRASMSAVKVAVLDTGCDDTHPDFAAGTLKKVTSTVMRVWMAGREVVLPDPGSFAEANYNLGDGAASQHGTGVVSLIAAANGNVINGNADNDRGVNGLLHNPMPYTVQIYRGSVWGENQTDFVDQTTGAGSNTTTTVTEFLAVVNAAAITGAKVMNASWGQPYPINEATSPNRSAVRVALRKLAHQLNQFQTRVLLVVAAGNEAETLGDNDGNGFDDRDPEGMRGRITPFEDVNLNGVLDAGEDLNSDGALNNGNYVAASLGTLPNVLTVGAIGGPDNDGVAGAPRDWAKDDQRADFSCWGIPVKIAAPGAGVFVAGGPAGTFTIGGARYQRISGTSFATPLTTGTAALLKGLNVNLTPAAIKQTLIETAFRVRTTDGNATEMNWDTLKAGFAVRKVLLDKGAFGNDDEWTGVSKVVADGLVLIEIRRGADGRAEGFARRDLGMVGFFPTIRHDGTRVAFYATDADEYLIREYRFDNDTTSQLYAFPLDTYNMGQPLEYSPSGHLFWTLHGPLGPCTDRHRYYVLKPDLTDELVAEQPAHNTCQFDEGGNPLPWQITFPLRANWRPDNRKWDLDYVHQQGVGGTGIGGRPVWADNDYPGGPYAFPGFTGVEFWLTCWSYDGHARAGASRNDAFEELLLTRYYNDARAMHTQRSRKEPDFLRWINWSPDSSEVAYFGRLTTEQQLMGVRRDFRNLADRNTGAIGALTGGSFSWQW